MQTNPPSNTTNSYTTSSSPANLLEPGKTMYIVGNAKVDKDCTAEINAADLVVRFNKLDNYNKGTGTKIDLWVQASNKFLINRSIEEPASITGNTGIPVKEIISQTQSLIFAIPPLLPIHSTTQYSMFQRLLRDDKTERVESIYRFLEHFNSEQHPFRILEFPDKYVNELAPDLWRLNWTCPSNGYLMVRTLIDDLSFYKYRKILVGFNWEGWDGHPWILEKLFMERLERDNVITIIKN